VALVRNQMIERVRERHTSPDGYLSLLSDSVSFNGQPYALQPEGTETSLPGLDSAALAGYARAQIVTSRMLLVVVGNVSRESVEHAVAATLATLPAGQYVWALPATAPRELVPAVLRERHVATNYVLGVFEGPPASSPDYPAFRVATELLSSRIQQKVRTEHALSYAAFAPFTDRAIATGGIYFTTNLPDRVLPIIKEQVDFVRHLPTELIDMHYFTDAFIFDYLANNSTDNAQADFLARAQLYEGDYRKASDAMEELRRVTTGRVRAAAQHYFSHIQFVYVGDTTKVMRSAFATF
jgi:zinc protease